MSYQDSKNMALPELARIAADVAANVTARIAAFEALELRAAEIWETGAWLGFSDSERAALRAWSALDADAIALRDFISEGV